MRFACLWLPELPLAAALRAEPELAGRALAITEDAECANPRIVAGELRGYTLSAARALRTELAVRRLSSEAVSSAEQALFDVALSLTPRVERAAPGTLQLDLAGCGALYPSRGGPLLALETRLGRVGLGTTRAGLGPTRTIAWLAARCDGAGHTGDASGSDAFGGRSCAGRGGDRPGRGGRVVTADASETFLAPLPLRLLEPDAELTRRLASWGVRTLGELRQLPRRALGARLGRAGVRLARLAAGEDLEPFRPSAPPPRFEERLQLEAALDNLEALGFALRAVLGRLAARLRVRGLAARELWLELGLEDGTRWARRVGLRGATAEEPVLLAQLRLALQREPPHAAAERIGVAATPGAPAAVQGDLFAPPLPSPGGLALTLARLEALCGAGRVGAPLRGLTHRPEGSALAPFAEARHAPPGAPAPRAQTTLALRALRPPRPLQVRTHGGLPEQLELEGGTPQAVLQRAGPWRLSGEWWSETPFERDYFDVALAGGGLYRIYCDLATQRWFADGLYD